MWKAMSRAIAGVSVLAVASGLAPVACTPPPSTVAVVKTAPPPSPSSAPNTQCVLADGERARVSQLLAAGRLDRVLRVLAKADQLCPPRAMASYAVAIETLAALDRWDEAATLATTIEKSTISTVDATDAREMSDAKEAAARLRARIAKYRVKTAPTDESRKLAMQAAAAADANKHKEAMDLWLGAWELAHPDGDALLGAALSARALGQGAEAQRLFDRAAVDLGAGPGRPLAADVPNGFEGYLQAIAFAPMQTGRKTIAVAHRSIVSVLDARTLREVLRLSGHALSVTSLAYSSDGRILASASRDGTARLWSTSGALLAKLDGHESTVNAIAFSPDGRTVATVSSDRTAKLWDAVSGKELSTFQQGGGEVLSVAFSPDGRYLVTGADDRTARLYDAKTFGLVTTLDGHGGRVRAIAFVPGIFGDKKSSTLLATGDDHGTLRIAEVTTKGALKLLQTIEAHAGAIVDIAVAADARTLVTAGVDQVARTFDARSGVLLRTFEGHELMTTSVAFGEDVGTLYTGAYATLREWDATSGKLRRNVRGHAAPLDSVAIAPDLGALAAGESDGLVALWPTSLVDGHGQSPKLLDAHTGSVSALVFAPTSLGNLLASGSSDGTVRFWDSSVGIESAAPWKVGFARALTFAPNLPVLAAATVDAGVQRYDVSTKKPLPHLEGPGAYGVDYLADGSRFVVAAAGKAVIVRDANGNVLQTLLGHTGFVNAVAVSPDGTTLASASSDRTVRLWNLADGAPIAVLGGHEGPVLAVAYRPQGSVLVLASASADGTIRLWDAKTHKEAMKLGAPLDDLGTPTVPLGAVTTMAISRDGAWLVSGSRDGTMHLWSLPDAQLRLSFRNAIGGGGAYAFAPSGAIEIFGNARLFPVCRIGARTFPFELCEEHFTESGLLSRVLAGESLDMLVLPR